MGNPNTDNDGKSIVADALDQSYTGSFGNGLRLLYGVVDNVILGTTGHKDYWLTHKKIKEDDTMDALKDGRVSKMFLELPIYRQGLIKDFQDDVANLKVDADSHLFAFHFEHDDTKYMGREIESWSYNFTDTYEYLRHYIAPILTEAKGVGIDAHAVDLENGWPENNTQIKECDEAEAAKKKFISLKKEFGIANPETQKAEGASLKEDRECGKYSIEYIEKRHSDFNVAQTINGIKKQDINDVQKSLICIGAAHGSRKNDFEEYLDGRTLKVDFAANKEAYVKDYGDGIVEEFNKLGYAIGEDPPDLVYLIEEGVWMTTTNTPKDIVDLIQNSDDFKRVESVEAAVRENSNSWSVELPAFR